MSECAGICTYCKHLQRRKLAYSRMIDYTCLEDMDRVIAFGEGEVRWIKDIR
jgi:hypothetical protein